LHIDYIHALSKKKTKQSKKQRQKNNAPFPVRTSLPVKAERAENVRVGLEMPYGFQITIDERLNEAITSLQLSSLT